VAVAAGAPRFLMAWTIAIARITTATAAAMRMRFLVLSMRDGTDFTDWRCAAPLPVGKGAARSHGIGKSA